MLTSMTGYGRASISSRHGRFIIEIQSLNRKFLESFIPLRRELSRFEVEIRKWIAEKIKRGQISVRIMVVSETKDVKDLLPDALFLKKLKTGWEKLADSLKISKDEVNLLFLAEQIQPLMQTKEVGDEQIIRKALQEGIKIALKELMIMKQKEGTTLTKDLKKRVMSLKKLIGKIKENAHLAPLKYREKLEKRLKEFATDIDIDEKILREIAIFSEKIDITEEIIRFLSHLEQFSLLLKASKEAVGRKMDFLIQELVREINTIAAKSSSVGISKMVIEIKSELEKIREQVQNIE